MTLQLPGVSVVGGFILTVNGAALNIRHIESITMGGREEDLRTPRAKNVHLVATLAPGDEDDSYILARFATFMEAGQALDDLLKAIEYAPERARERIEEAQS